MHVRWGSSTSAPRNVALYLAMVGLPLAGVLIALHAGRHLMAPVATVGSGGAGLDGASASTGAPSTMPPFLLLLLQMGVVLSTARIVGRAFRSLGQPQVAGEIVAGLLLGPSALGVVAPGVFTALFPASSLTMLGSVSQIGLVLFMFLVGLELEPALLRRRGHTALLASHASITIPFFLGTLLALVLYPRLSNTGVRFGAFALFMGAAMSVTAFPVLARILTERRLVGTTLGAVAIACAAVDDVSAWCILAAVVVLVRSQGGDVPLWLTVGGGLRRSSSPCCWWSGRGWPASDAERVTPVA